MNSSLINSELSKYGDVREYVDCVKDIINNDTVMSMSNYNHHFETNCLEHSISVSYYCYLLCKKFKWDYRSAARAGLLHDLFLYDWTTHKRDTGEKFHGLTHPLTAYNNAKEIFELNNIEKDMIIKHMWPLTLRFPRYKESYVIVLADKYCGTLEVFQHYIKAIFSLA